MSSIKNNKEATKLRNFGNDHFEKNEFFEALLKYNHSLCFAEPGSDCVGLAYANRSAVYFEVKEFDKCIENIELARNSNYPSDKLKKLIEREESCITLMKTFVPNPDDNPFNFFKLSYPPNRRYPGIVDCLALNNNQKFGNHIVTKQALKTGDIIGIEDPIFTAASPDARLHRCSYCFKDNLLHLLPCNGCTSG